MAALSVYDVRHRRLPNWLTLTGFAAIVLVAADSGRGPAAWLGAAALTAVYLLVHLLSPTAMGAGDVKLALGLGALNGCLGADVWLLAAIGAPLLTAVVGMVADSAGRRRRCRTARRCVLPALPRGWAGSAAVAPNWQRLAAPLLESAAGPAAS